MHQARKQTPVEGRLPRTRGFCFYGVNIHRIVKMTMAGRTAEQHSPAKNGHSRSEQSTLLQSVTQQCSAGDERCDPLGPAYVRVHVFHKVVPILVCMSHFPHV